jgi:hypothetical protein
MGPYVCPYSICPIVFFCPSDDMHENRKIYNIIKNRTSDHFCLIHMHTTYNTTTHSELNECDKNNTSSGYDVIDFTIFMQEQMTAKKGN